MGSVVRQRWAVVARDVNGKVIGRTTFFWRRSADSLKRWQDLTAWGEHPWMTSITAEHGPLWTTTIERLA